VTDKALGPLVVWNITILIDFSGCTDGETTGSDGAYAEFPRGRVLKSRPGTNPAE
jgi:hypothetical protein